MNGKKTSTTSPTRAFVGRIAGTDVFDPVGDRVGRAYDVVAIIGTSGKPQVVGLVVEVSSRHLIFVPFSRITSVKVGAIITTGVLNMRRFKQRAVETLLVTQLLDRLVTMRDGSGKVYIRDVEIEKMNSNEWKVSGLFVERERRNALGFRRAGETLKVKVADVSNISVQLGTQDATSLIANTEEMKPADLADYLHNLPDDRMLEVASQLADERLADVLEELGETHSVSILESLENTRAADVLELMQPDDAADLIGEMQPETADELLSLMEKEEAADVRRLMSYEDYSAGGLMTTEPVILGPDDTVAQLLASVRREDIPPALAAMTFIVRPPHQTPTGRLIGVVHTQRALREPPQTLLGSIVDTDVEEVTPEMSIATVTRLLATYNLTALPVVNEDECLLGAVSVDDVLDHLLPDDWRDQADEVTDAEMEERYDV